MTFRNELNAASVRAQLGYQDPVKPGVHYIVTPSKSTWGSVKHETVVTDARPFVDELDLEKNGFVLVNAPTKLEDYDDEKQINTVYAAEIEALVKRLTGAVKVVMFNALWRDGSEASEQRHYAPVAHVDFTQDSYAFHARHALGAEADEWLARRWIGLNAWRPIKVVESHPLAVCDTRTVSDEDFMLAPVAMNPGDPPTPITGQHLIYNPKQRWYYFPRMVPDEILLFKIEDKDSSRSRRVAHAALTDGPASPPNAPTRRSFEVRLIAFL